MGMRMHEDLIYMHSVCGDALSSLACECVLHAAKVGCVVSPLAMWGVAMHNIVQQ